ncbi:major tail protein [Clostridium butyricum]|uniref:major tail protein n=1 Tax=Clostridium butyricum TaxID=1492 RepID=UPI002AB03FAF|nr:major tail protein [Clostridium butyricum]
MAFRSLIGVRNIHIAKCLTDGNWDTPIKLTGAQEITIKNTYAEGSLIGDMKKLKSTKKKTGLDVSVGVAEYTNTIKALLEGGEVVKGEYVNSADELGNDVAVLFEQVFDDNSSNYVVIYKVGLRPENYIEGKGNSENIEYATTTLTGTAVAVDIDGKSLFSFELDTSAEGVDATKVSKWFTAVQTPTVEAA